MSDLRSVEIDLESLASDMDGMSDILHIIVDDLEENTGNPPRVKMDANAIRQCVLMYGRTEDDMRILAKRITAMEAVT